METEEIIEIVQFRNCAELSDISGDAIVYTQFSGIYYKYNEQIPAFVGMTDITISWQLIFPPKSRHILKSKGMIIHTPLDFYNLMKNVIYC